jgi:O-antigen/teichoic acid export membrane protein
MLRRYHRNAFSPMAGKGMLNDQLGRLRNALGSLLNLCAITSLFSKRSGDRGRERYRRAGITASTSFLAKALNIVISFVSVPLTVHYLGAERYGVWLVISSLLTWMAMTDFGLAGNALVNVLAESDGHEDRGAAHQYSASAFWALSAIGLTIGLAFLAAFPFIPWRAVFNVSAAVPSQELSAACALTLFLFVLGMPLSMLNSVYNAYQDGFVMNLWGIASNALALVSLVVVTQFRGGLFALVVALSGTRSAVHIANGLYLFWMRYPWLVPSPSAVRWARIKRLLKLGAKYLVTQLSSLGIYQSQPMIITQMLGPSQVVVFVVAQKILTLPNDLAYMGTAPFISAFSEAKARRDWNWIKGAYRNSTLGALAFGVPLTVAIALAAKPLVRVWAGPEAVPGYALIIWLSIYTLIGIALMSAGQLMCGLERVDPLAISITLCAIGVVGLGILFAPWWGLSGVAAAMAVSKILTFWPIQIREVRRIFRAVPALTEASEAPAVVSTM